MRIERLKNSYDKNFFVYCVLCVESAVRCVTLGLYKPFIFGLLDYLIDELEERRHNNV